MTLYLDEILLELIETYLLCTLTRVLRRCCMSNVWHTELGGLQDAQWPVLRQAMHQAVVNLTKTAVIANSDMGDDRCAVICIA